jgi:hypothetical protein
MVFDSDVKGLFATWQVSDFFTNHRHKRNVCDFQDHNADGNLSPSESAPDALRLLHHLSHSTLARARALAVRVAMVTDLSVLENIERLLERGTKVSVPLCAPCLLLMCCGVRILLLTSLGIHECCQISL